MKLAAADAIFRIASEDLGVDHIVPSALDPRVAPAVAAAVAESGRLGRGGPSSRGGGRGTRGLVNGTIVRVITCEPNGHRVPVAAPR